MYVHSYVLKHTVRIIGRIEYEVTACSITNILSIPKYIACFLKSFQNYQQSNANNIVEANKIKRIAMSRNFDSLA